MAPQRLKQQDNNSLFARMVHARLMPLAISLGG